MAASAALALDLIGTFALAISGATQLAAPHSARRYGSLMPGRGVSAASKRTHHAETGATRPGKDGGPWRLYRASRY